MIPSTTAAVVVFVLLVSPGIAFELLWQRSRPRRDETMFVEISRVLLAGVAFSGVATLMMVVVAAVAPGAAADLPALVRDGQGYLARQPGLTLGTVATVVVCRPRGGCWTASTSSICRGWRRRGNGPGRRVPARI